MSFLIRGQIIKQVRRNSVLRRMIKILNETISYAKSVVSLRKLIICFLPWRILTNNSKETKNKNLVKNNQHTILVVIKVGSRNIHEKDKTLVIVNLRIQKTVSDHTWHQELA